MQTSATWRIMRDLATFQIHLKQPQAVHLACQFDPSFSCETYAWPVADLQCNTVASHEFTTTVAPYTSQYKDIKMFETSHQVTDTTRRIRSTKQLKHNTGVAFDAAFLSGSESALLWCGVPEFGIRSAWPACLSISPFRFLCGLCLPSASISA